MTVAVKKDAPCNLTFFESLGETVLYTKGAEICQASAVPEYCYLIKRGIVKAHEYDPNGKEVVFAVWGADTLILSEAALLQTAAHVTYTAQTDLVLIRYSARHLEAIKRSSPKLFASAMHSLSASIGFYDYVRALQTQTPEQRLYNLLLLYAKEYAEDINGMSRIKERVSLARLAPLIGACTVTAARAMQALKAKNLVEHREGSYWVRRNIDLVSFMPNSESLNMMPCDAN